MYLIIIVNKQIAENKFYKKQKGKAPIPLYI